MNIQQLRYLREVATNGFSISKAAKTLHTSQPGISQQIIALERELGLPVFVRDKKRLVGLTKQGEQIIARAASALLDIDYISKFAHSVAKTNSGQLVIATTHTQARYVLPETLSLFARKYPKVRVTLEHANPTQIEQALASGAADIGVSPYIGTGRPDIVGLECRRYRRIVLAPKGHPLLKKRRCNLEDLAKHPLIAFERSIFARQMIIDIFAAEGLTPNFALTAIDADVVKACVEVGLGIAILIELAYDPARDAGLGLLKADGLFPSSVTSVAIHRRHHLPPCAFDFIEMFSPKWNRGRVENALLSKKTAKRHSS